MDLSVLDLSAYSCLEHSEYIQNTKVWGHYFELTASAVKAGICAKLGRVEAINSEQVRFKKVQNVACYMIHMNYHNISLTKT